MWVRIFIGAAIVYAGYVALQAIRQGGAGGSRKFKCATCKSCGRLFEDGVICKFKGRKTFKNATHISNCIDYERR